MSQRSEAVQSSQPSHIRVPFYFCIATLLIGLVLMICGKSASDFDYTGTPADSIDPFLAWGFFWSGLCLLTIGTVGFLLARFWWRAWERHAPSSFHPKLVHFSCYWWMALVACILLGASLRIPLLQHSFWWDETWGVKRVIAGEWQEANPNDGALVLEKPSWKDTFFHFSKPTNHVTYSIFARVCHEIWILFGGEGVAEWVIRLPALVFGLALIWLGADLCRRWGFPLAGLLLALLLALHPWFIRYSVDARAYTLIALLSLLLLANGLSLLKSNKRRRWLSYALFLAFSIWSFPFIFFFAAPLSIGILLIGTIYPETTGLRSSVFFLRWLSTHALALVLVLPLVAPLIPQIGYWDAESRNHAALDYGAFLPRLYAEYSLGMPWNSTTEDEDIMRPSLTQHEIPGARIYTLFVIPLLGITGLLFLYHSCKRFFLLMLIGLAAVIFTILLSWFSHTFLYSRFLIFGAVLFCCCLAIGAEGIARLLNRYTGKIVAILFVVMIPVVTALYTEPQRELFQQRAFAPVRETAQIIQQWSEKFPDLMVLAYYPTWDSLSVYYPAVVPIHHLDELDIMENISRRDGRPLLFVVELRDFILFPQQQLQKHIFESQQFVESHRLVGADLNSTHLILFYQPQ
jgi:preprotein translocase subunit SecG